MGANTGGIEVTINRLNAARTAGEQRDRRTAPTHPRALATHDAAPTSTTRPDASREQEYDLNTIDPSGTGPMNG